MKQSTLRIWIGVVLFLGGLILALLVIALTAAGGYTGNQQKLLLLIISPMLMPSMTAAVRYLLSLKRQNVYLPVAYATAGEKIFGLGPVILFPVILALALIAKAYNFVVRDFDSFLIEIAAIEGFFGVIIALVTQHFFAEEKAASST